VHAPLPRPAPDCSAIRLRAFAIVLGIAAATLATLAGCGDEPGAGPSSPELSTQASVEQAALGEKVFPVERAPVLDNTGRDEWQKPREVVAALAIEPGARVADIGCGTGYFAVRFVRATGKTGRVLAVDIQQGMLDILEGRLASDDRERVELRLSQPDRPLEPADAVDLAFCANTLHEVDEQGPFMQALADGIAPGGRLAIIEWLPKDTGMGPPLEHRLTPERITELAKSAGLRLEQSVSFLEMHSFLIYRKPE